MKSVLVELSDLLTDDSYLLKLVEIKDVLIKEFERQLTANDYCQNLQQLPNNLAFIFENIKLNEGCWYLGKIEKNNLELSFSGYERLLEIGTDICFLQSLMFGHKANLQGYLYLHQSGEKHFFVNGIDCQGLKSINYIE